ncbi:MAG: hypothetical protein ACLT98_02580 [Eggerthellaceae bacterium]
MAVEKPTVTDKASPLEMEKVKHSSLEYAVQHDGPAYRQRAVAPYKESALPELTRGEAARSVFKDRVSESVGNALGAAKGAAEGAARGAAKGREGRPAQPRAALEMSAAIGLSTATPRSPTRARAADTVANAAMTQPTRATCTARKGRRRQAAAGRPAGARPAGTRNRRRPSPSRTRCSTSSSTEGSAPTPCDAPGCQTSPCSGAGSTSGRSGSRTRRDGSAPRRAGSPGRTPPASAASSCSCAAPRRPSRTPSSAGAAWPRRAPRWAAPRLSA